MWDNDLGTPSFSMRMLRLADNTVIEAVRVCGRDNDSVEGSLSVTLRRKALRGGDIFAESEIIAGGSSGIPFAEDANRCFDFPTNVVVDNNQYIYLLVIGIEGPIQISAAQVDYR